MTRKVGALEAKNKFSEIMEQVAYTKQRVLVERRGKPMIAIVPAADLARLESMDSDEAVARRKQAMNQWLTDAAALQAKIMADWQGNDRPAAADLIREAREERLNDLP